MLANRVRMVSDTGLPIGTVFNFPYTGGVQEIELPRGKYKLEVWGAQGGDGLAGGSVIYGGRGGYSKGTLILEEVRTLRIFTGGMGVTGTDSSTGYSDGGWNGGGRGYRKRAYSGGSGGGASDIRIDGQNLSNRIIVAGAGGGAGDGNSRQPGQITGGYGGGLTGGPTGITSDSSPTRAQGGTQSSGGRGGNWGSYARGESGSLGLGGDAVSSGSSSGGGGGGFYGGGGSTWIGGGGGSGYIKNLLIESQTIAGNKSIPKPSGGTQTGHSGNGYARITVI